MTILPPAYIDVHLAWAEFRDYPCATDIEATPMPAYILWLVTAGQLQLTVPDVPLVVPTGSLAIFPPHMRRDVRTSAGTRWFSIAIHPENPLTVSFLKQLRAPAVMHPDADERSAFEAIMQVLVQESSRADTVTPYSCGGLSLALVGLCLRRFGLRDLTQIEQSMPNWLALCLQTIELHPGITVGALAEQAGYSVAQFRHLFTHWIGVPPHAYLQRRQLQVAQSLLLSFDLSIADIAERIGCKTQSYFTRMFKHATGMPPIHYRQSYRDNTHLRG